MQELSDVIKAISEKTGRLATKLDGNARAIDAITSSKLAVSKSISTPLDISAGTQAAVRDKTATKRNLIPTLTRFVRRNRRAEWMRQR